MSVGASMVERKYLNFAFEDTSDRSYREISKYLVLRGWNKVAHKKRSKLEKRRLPMKQVPLLIWTLQDKDIDYSTLLSHQLVNHYEGISTLTTKRGFCDLVRHAVDQVGRSPFDVSPRGYNLGDPLHREEFIEDFHISSCVNILKWATLCITRQYAASSIQNRKLEISKHKHELNRQLDIWNSKVRGNEHGADNVESTESQYCTEPATHTHTAKKLLDEVVITQDGVNLPVSLLRLAVQALCVFLRTNSGDCPDINFPNPTEKKDEYGHEQIIKYTKEYIYNNDMRSIMQCTRKYNSRVRDTQKTGRRTPYGGNRLKVHLRPWPAPVSAAQSTGTNNNNNGSSTGGHNSNNNNTTNTCSDASTNDFMNHSSILSNYGLQDAEWDDLLNMSYTLAAASAQSPTHIRGNHLNELVEGSELEWMKQMTDIHRTDVKSLLKLSSILPLLQSDDITDAGRLYGSALHTHLLLILSKCSKIPQLQFDLSSGFRNIWVVKAPDASCGLGLKLLYKLSDILSAEKGLGGKNCQKYVENPLLLCSAESAAVGNKTNATVSMKDRRHPEKGSAIAGIDVSQITNATMPSSSSSCVVNAGNTLTPTSVSRKFDLRIWVLVTSFFPLRAYVYSGAYGRACAVQYTVSIGDDGNLADPKIHFTNYAVQSQENNGSSTKDTENSKVSTASGGGSAKVRALRGTVDTFRTIGCDDAADSNTAGVAGSSQNDQKLGDLLVSTSELIDCINGSRKRVSNPQNSSNTKWNMVWHKIRQKILSTLLAARTTLPVEGRDANGQPKQKHNNCFEFLGYDVILDGHTLEPYILEANLSPAIARRNSDHAAMIRHMSHGLAQLAIVPHEQIADCKGENQSNSSSLLESFKQQQLVQESLVCGISNITASSSSSISPGAPSFESPKSDSSGSYSPSPVQEATPVGQWEPLHREDDTYDYAMPEEFAVGGMNSPRAGYRVAAPNKGMVPMYREQMEQWEVVRDGNTAVYTKVENSPGFSLRAATAPEPHKVLGVDIAFSLQGKGITKNGVKAIDRANDHFASILLLQKWARRYCIQRMRLWRENSKHAIRLCQRIIRRYLRLCRSWHRRRYAAALSIQCCIRRVKAKCNLLHLRRIRCALLVQTKYRQNKAKMFTTHLRHQHYSARIQCWFRRFIRSWRKTNAMVISRVVRKWYLHRYRAKRIVRLVVRSYWRRRKRFRNTVFRFCMVACQKQYKWLLGRKLHARRVADLCVHAAMQRRHRIEEQKRTEERQMEICLMSIVEIIISEDLFAVQISDMWAVPGSKHVLSGKHSTGSDIRVLLSGTDTTRVKTLGVTVAELVKDVIYEEREAEKRNAQFARELKEEKHRQYRELGIPIPQEATNQHEVTVSTAAISTEKGKATLAEATAEILKHARSVLASPDYLQYKDHVLALQHQVFANTCETRNAQHDTDNTDGYGLRNSRNKAAQWEDGFSDPKKSLCLPVQLPQDLFIEYEKYQKQLLHVQSEMERQRQELDQQSLNQDIQDGKILRYNGRVIDTSNFRVPPPPNQTTKRNSSTLGMSVSEKDQIAVQEVLSAQRTAPLSPALRSMFSAEIPITLPGKGGVSRPSSSQSISRASRARNIDSIASNMEATPSVPSLPPRPKSAVAANRGGSQSHQRGISPRRSELHKNGTTTDMSVMKPGDSSHREGKRNHPSSLPPKVPVPPSSFQPSTTLSEGPKSENRGLKKKKVVKSRKPSKSAKQTRSVSESLGNAVPGSPASVYSSKSLGVDVHTATPMYAVLRDRSNLSNMSNDYFGNGGSDWDNLHGATWDGSGLGISCSEKYTLPSRPHVAPPPNAPVRVRPCPIPVQPVDAAFNSKKNLAQNDDTAIETDRRLMFSAMLSSLGFSG